MLDPPVLAAQVTAAKANLSSLHIPVTISELAFGYQVGGLPSFLTMHACRILILGIPLNLGTRERRLAAGDGCHRPH